jgi:hypothetical protein
MPKKKGDKNKNHIEYICPKCCKNYGNQKFHYENHIKRKTPCFKQNVENKQSYLIGFYFNEARLLKEFLTYSLNSVFEAQRIEAIKKAKNSPKETKEVNAADQEDSELW